MHMVEVGVDKRIQALLVFWKLLGQRSTSGNFTAVDPALKLEESLLLAKRKVVENRVLPKQT